MDLIKPDEKSPVPETSIDLNPLDKVLTIKINLNMGPVNAYGTCQLAMEYCCRYFTTLEIAKRKLMQDDAQAEAAKAETAKNKIDSELSKIGIVLPRR
jgi:hypothetical protein